MTDFPKRCAWTKNLVGTFRVCGNKIDDYAVGMDRISLFGYTIIITLLYKLHI